MRRAGSHAFTWRSPTRSFPDRQLEVSSDWTVGTHSSIQWKVGPSRFHITVLIRNSGAAACALPSWTTLPLTQAIPVLSDASAHEVVVVSVLPTRLQHGVDYGRGPRDARKRRLALR